MTKKTYDDITQLARGVLKACKDIGAHVYKRAKSGSCSIKFSRQDLGSLRISDHNGYLKYSYHWNIRLDLTEHRVGPSNEGYTRDTYPKDQVQHFIKDIRASHERKAKHGDNFPPQKRQPEQRLPGHG